MHVDLLPSLFSVGLYWSCYCYRQVCCWKILFCYYWCEVMVNVGGIDATTTVIRIDSSQNYVVWPEHFLLCQKMPSLFGNFYHSLQKCLLIYVYSLIYSMASICSQMLLS